MKRHIPLMVGIAIFLYVLWWVGTSQVLEVLQNVSVSYFLAALALMGVSYGIKFLRWVILVRGRHTHITLSQLLIIFAVNYGLSVSLPSKTGDIAGLEVSRRFAGIPYGDAASFVAFYRIYDIAIVLVMAAVSSLSISNWFDIEWLKAVLMMCTLILIVLFIFFLLPITSEKMVGLLLRLMNRVFGQRATTLRQSIQKIFADYLETIRVYHQKKRMLFAVAMLTGVRWLLELIAFSVLLSSVGVEVGLGIVALLLSLRIIITVLALVPFGLGTTLLPTLAIFDIIGVSRATGIATDVLSHFIGPILTAVIGLAFTGCLREDRDSSSKE